ncbi:MAG: transposase [Chthoniobacteraceae bacterium]
MPRSIRIEYPNALYHVMARGNRREFIFRDDDDRRFFLKTLAEACERTGWRVHAWVLMGSHYHLLIRTPEANLVAGMKWLQNTYTRRFNIRHKLWGRLFGDRYKAVPVEGGGYYYETLLDYIHLNPVRAGLVKPRSGQSVLDYPWSSVAGGCALPPSRRPKWLAAGEALRAFGLADTAQGRRKWVERLDRQARQEAAARCGVPMPDPEADRRGSHLRRGWYWGSQAFAERLLEKGAAILKKKRNRDYRSSLESRAHGEQEALRLLAEGLEAAGLRPGELKGLKGSDVRKVAIARVIHQQTTVNLPWLAERLSMRSAANVSQQLRRSSKAVKSLSKPLKTWLNLSRIAA